MITRAALCPSPPLLARELTGRDPVVPGLREACAEAVARLAATALDAMVVTGPGAATASWDPDGRLGLSVYAPALGKRGKPGLPLSLGLGALLLDAAGYSGPRILQAVGEAESADACLRLGARLATSVPRAALLVMGDGSARRSQAAPGHLDERAVPFDEDVERAVRDGDMAALAAVNPGLARDLMATGRSAWQVLAGALGVGSPGRGRATTEILYADAPFGVFYLVALLEPPPSPDQ